MSLVSIMDPETVIGHHCGYCGSENGSISDGLWATKLTCLDYQKLIDWGWRRSGSYLYKPRMKETCCPAYTIRLDVNLFEFTKSHKKTLKSFAKHLNVSLPDSASLDSWMDVILQSPRFKTETVNSSFDHDCYNLYRKYQMIVHHDAEHEISEKGYRRFLVESPLFSETSNEGSFHQKYYIDDRLVAVGVMDKLPYCLSSVYFYYDPDMKDLSLGKFSALYEIYQVRKLISDSYHYYYMGFYIHSCDKMKYKGSYCPSDLCDPESHIWIRLSSWVPLLNQSKYASFQSTEDSCNSPNIGPKPFTFTLMIGIRVYKIPASQIESLPGEDLKRIFKYYAKLLDEDLVKSLTFHLQ